MRHQVAFIVKILGLICLLLAVISTLSLISSLFIYFDGYIVIISILPITALFIFFTLFVYKTEEVINFFKLSEVEDPDILDEKPYSMTKRTAFKSGIFIIGFYLLASNAPNVLIQLVSWLAFELEGTSGNSLDRLITIFSPFNRDSIIYSIIYSVSGYVMALENAKIAAFFMKKDE